MIVFHNPGLIEPNAFRLSGASVKAEGSFGRFGTGLKYAVATILRGGGSIVVHSGSRTFSFQLEETTLKDVTFSEVVLVEGSGNEGTDYTPLGFTVDLGKDWEPWMVIRELGCNARDEGGNFCLSTDPEEDRRVFSMDDYTMIVLDWPAVEAVWPATVAETFMPHPAEALLHGEDNVYVFPGPSEYLYHRGVRVWKLPKPSVFTYDLMGKVDLTEDRTVKYSFCVVADVRNMILGTSERSLIAAAVSAAPDTWEGSFDWGGTQWAPKAPGPDWLEEAAVIRDRRAGLTKSAADVLLNHSAFKTATKYGGGAYSYEEASGAYGEVVAVLEELGIDLEKVQTFVADELPGEQKTTVRNGSVYVSKDLLENGYRIELAEEMLKRWLELKSSGSFDVLLDLVVPLLLNQNYDLKREREWLVKYREDNPVKAAVEAAEPGIKLLYEPSAALADDSPF